MGQSVRLSFLHVGGMDFLHIGDHDLVPNLSNYLKIFITFECCDILEKNVVILFIFGTVISYHVLLMHVK